MIPVFESVKEVEKEISVYYSSDEFIAETLMIENASSSLEKIIFKNVQKVKSILIMCGSGNNGADGYSLARRLAEKVKVSVLQVSEPKSIYCQRAFDNIKSLVKKAIDIYELKSEVKNTKLEKVINSASVIVDCIFGTGFHNLVDEKIVNLFKVVNHSDAFRIACDIPSGIDLNCSNISSFSLQKKKHYVFCADVTATMGAHKMALFSDNAKDLVGKIKCCSIGISNQLFYQKADKVFPKNKIYLLEKDDVTFPVRNELNTHKGKFGHSVVIGGEKLGAAILCATSAFRCGAGLSSIARCAQNEMSNFQSGVEKFSQYDFKIPACVMISDEIPSNVTSLVLGAGLGRDKNLSTYLEFIESKKVPVVFDADVFYYNELIQFLDSVCSKESDSAEKNQKIILTPHLKEFSVLLKNSGLGDFSIDEIIVKRVELMRLFCNKYKNVVLVLKGANTFIGLKNKIYICKDGHPSLSKGGSGDVLSGAISGLLAQNYSESDAAISGVMMHAIASSKFKKTYNLLPEDLVLEL